MAELTTSRTPRAARPVSGIVRFGSLAVQLHAGRTFWAEALVRRFRAQLEPLPPRSPTSLSNAVDAPVPEIVLDINDTADGSQPGASVDGDALRIERGGDEIRVLSDLMTLVLDQGVRPQRATLTVHEPHRAAGQPGFDRGAGRPHGAGPALGLDDRLEHYYAVFVHKLLQLSGIVRLHGAAVEWNGAAHVFLGDKGAGKSTIALALGRAGGRVLADDQIAVRRLGGRVLVSGCDGHIRLTAHSEQHFLDAPLDALPQDFAGTMKKEVALAALVPAIPHTDVPATHLYFPLVGGRFGAQAISPRTAVVRILEAIVPAHRFAGPEDRLDLVRLVGDFVAPLACADVELSPRLEHIGQLVDYVAGSGGK